MDKINLNMKDIAEAKNWVKVDIQKVSSLEDAIIPNNIGNEYSGIHYIHEDVVPIIGKRFNTTHISTSPVKEIVDNNHFKTLNSLYRWEIIKD